MNIRQDSYTDWLKLYDWEAFLTVRLPGDVHPVKSYPHLVEDILRPLTRLLKTRVSAISVVSFGHPGLQRPHIHALLTSKSRQLLPRIIEAQRYLSITKTTLSTHSSAVDLRPFFEERHLHYTAQHIVADSDVNYYDRKLLETLKTKGVTQ